MIPETFANKSCILNPENVHEWIKEEIAAFGLEKARAIFAARAELAFALVPMWARYVCAAFEPLYKQAAQMWREAANA